MSRDDYGRYPDASTEHDPNAPDPKVLARVTSLFPLLVNWQASFEKPTDIVEGGELAEDDLDGQWPGVSEVAEGSMPAAYDHLLAEQTSRGDATAIRSS